MTFGQVKGVNLRLFALFNCKEAELFKHNILLSFNEVNVEIAIWRHGISWSSLCKKCAGSAILQL